MLDDDNADFIQTGVAISLASSAPGQPPNCTRALGCRLTAGGQVVLFLPAAQAAGVLADIRQNHRVAAVFALPSSHRTVQLKGEDARVLPFDPADHAIVARHLETFVAELAHLGIPEAIIRTVYGCPGSDLVAVAFTPCAAFSQTPGPRAGQPLGAAP